MKKGLPEQGSPGSPWRTRSEDITVSANSSGAAWPARCDAGL